MCLNQVARYVMATLLIASSLWPGDALPPDDQVQKTVDGQVAEWWPRSDEKRFDQIGWASNIQTARRLAAEHSRPVFLFTMDGRVNLGRC
jgi:hypothetical protein